MDLIGALRRRVLEVIDGVVPPSRYKVVVVDAKVKQMLELVVEKGELLNRQVANVLVLDEKRPMEPFLDAVYLVEQSTYSFGCIEADFSVNRYAGAHVFLLPKWKASDTELHKFEQTLSEHRGKMALRQLHELPIGFSALEQRLFSLQMPSANLILYNGSFQTDVMSLVDLTGKQLAHVCSALHISPYVRYTARTSVVRSNAWPTLVARAANKHLNELGASNSSSMGSKRANLLILDRTVDLGAPLRHEPIFQALSMDLTNGKGAPPNSASEVPKALKGRTMGIKFEDFKGGYPSEKDKLWRQVRHEHIVSATQQLTANLRELRAANPHFEQTAEQASVGDVRNMLAALPEFMKARESVGLNLDLAQECITALEQPQLQQLMDFEQTLTLGTDDMGEYTNESQLADSLVSVLAQPHDATTKVRALALYVLYRRGIRAADYERLQKHARLREPDIEAVRHMNFLGMPTEFDPAAAQSDEYPPNLTKEYPRKPLKFHRVQPGIQTVIQQVLSGQLPETDYPYAGEMPDASQEALATATSLRNRRQKATWAQQVVNQGENSISGGMADKNDTGTASSSSGKTLVVFVLGGYTASEAASVYEVAKDSGVNVFLGGHDFLTPQKYVEFVRNMETSREELGIPEDKPEKQVPSFLLQPELKQDPLPSKSPSPGTRAPVHASVPKAAKASSPVKQRPAAQAPPRQPPVAQHSSTQPLVTQAKNNKLGGTPNLGPPRSAQPYGLQSQPSQQSNASPAPSASYSSGYTENGIMYLGSPPPPKEDKGMKKKLKGAFSALKR